MAGSNRGVEPDAERRFFDGARFAGEFFLGTSPVQMALDKLTERLESEGIPYAIVGAMALNEYGYRRVTTDVNVLLTREGLEKFRHRWLGRGYVEKFEGSRGLRDTENKIDIDVVVAGEYPGDGRPKAVVFPDPGDAGREGQRVRLLPVETFIEIKIASGISAAHRLRDLADVLELIRVTGLPRELIESLDPTVREKYLELWTAAQETDRITDALL